MFRLIFGLMFLAVLQLELAIGFPSDDKVNSLDSKPQNQQDALSIITQYKEAHPLLTNDIETMKFACDKNETRIVVAFLELGYDIDQPVADNDNGTCLHRAAVQNNAHLAKFLLDRGADVNAKSLNDWTPLMTTAYYESVEVATILIDHGADMTATAINKDNRTVLGLARFYNRPGMIKLLVSKGAPE